MDAREKWKILYKSKQNTRQNMNKPRRMRFTADDDLALLREVIAENPLADPDKWENIQKTLQATVHKNYLIRTLKAHLEILVEAYKEKGHDKLSVAVYSEKDRLLQEITEMCENIVFKKRKAKKEFKEVRIIEMGKKICLEATSTDPLKDEVLTIEEHHITDEESSEVVYLPEPCEEQIVVDETQSQALTPTRSTDPRCDLQTVKEGINLQHSLRKEENQSNIKNEELLLEERRIRLEERRIEMEEKRLAQELEERRLKLEIERDNFQMLIKEKRNLYRVIEIQNNLINQLQQKLK